MIEEYDSIVNSDVKQLIKHSGWIEDLAHYGLAKNQLDGTLAAAALFCPDIIRVKDYFFIKMFIEDSDDEKKLMETVTKLEEKYNYCKRDIEMAINSWSLGDFFLVDNDSILSRDAMLPILGEALCYFWQMRVQHLFPDRKIVVELGYELMGELGLCITMYELD